MGFHVEYADDPEQTTPRVFSNACGYQRWGGIHESLLSAFDLVDILNYCRDEGFRQGWNNALNRRCDGDRGPFDQRLLGGFPAAEWRRYYRFGQAAYAGQSVSPGQESEPPVV